MTNELELMAMGVVPYPSEQLSGVKRFNFYLLGDSRDVVMASDYDALALERDRQSVITGDYIAQCQRLQDERDALRDELSQLKAGHGEAVEIIAHLVLGGIFDGREYGDIDYQIEPDIAERLQQKNVKTAEDVQLDLMTVAQHERIVAAITASPPSDPGTVPVRPELLDSCKYELSSWMHDHGDDIKSRALVEELRDLLAQSEGVKP